MFFFSHCYHYVLSSCGFHAALSVWSDYLKFQLASIVMAVAVRADWSVIYTVPILRSGGVRSSFFHSVCAAPRMSFGIINYSTSALTRSIAIQTEINACRRERKKKLLKFICQGFLGMFLGGNTVDAVHSIQESYLNFPST